MVREDGLILAQFLDTKTQDGFRLEAWRRVEDYAADTFMNAMRERSKERGKDKCKMTITHEQVQEKMKSTPGTPFLVDTKFYTDFNYARVGVGKIPLKKIFLTPSLYRFA